MRRSRRRMTRRLALAVASALLLAACTGGGQAGRGGAMTEDMDAEAPRVPPVFGYYAGEEIFFIHTEVSDPKIAKTLEGMMGSPVPVVPALAEMPDAALSEVYVFTNGVTPEDTPLGPLGFQPDVFDSAPGDPEYTPLRRIVEVTWTKGAKAEVLKTVEQIRQVESAGQLKLKPTAVVVNAPFLKWPGGQR